jgi:hypothetical protein
MRHRSNNRAMQMGSAVNFCSYNISIHAASVESIAKLSLQKLGKVAEALDNQPRSASLVLL